jgi:hypothetical protein
VTTGEAEKSRNRAGKLLTGSRRPSISSSSGSYVQHSRQQQAVPQVNKTNKKKRHRDTWETKADALLLLDHASQGELPPGMTAFQYVVQQFGVANGTLSGWIKDSAKIMQAASQDKTKRLKAAKRITSRYPLAEKALYSEFLQRRSRGLRLSSFWVKAMGMKFVRDMYPETGIGFKASDNWKVRTP